MRLSVRKASAADEDAVRVVDRETWTSESSPVPVPGDERPFFDESTSPDDVLVAELDGAIVGYVKLGLSFPGPESAHVVTVRGLGVSPQAQGRGAGRALMEAAAEEGRRRGARRLTLRVLGHNEKARRLYERCGWEVEGVLRGEFVVDGREVDDVLMAKRL